MEFIEKQIGGIFFIPLFLGTGIKDNLKSYGRHKFTPDLEYAFARLIEIDPTNGDLIEVFSYSGAIPSTPDPILASPLLMKPVHVSMGFQKKRWRFVFETPDFDRETHSDYSKISFLMGPRDNRILWTGGVKSALPLEQVEKHEAWIVYPPTQMEERIRTNLTYGGKQA